MSHSDKMKIAHPDQSEWEKEKPIIDSSPVRDE
jgi:hypothetical protein